MASQEEDNKLECISNVNKEQERYFLNVYKKHECILNNKNETFENKVESLIDVWKSIAELNLSQFDIRHVIQIMDWAKLHALNIVLTAEWNAFKATCQTRLLQEIEKAQNELLKLNSGFATRCKKLADVVKNPWEDTVLMTLMKTKDAEIGPPEIEFFCVETAYVISVRLKKLCESQCEDLALNLVTAFMNCNKLSKTQNFNLNATETQMWFIFDIYIALLYKFQDKQKIVLLLKELSFEEGLQLVKRFAKKRVKISKIWKNCHKVAVLATQMYISQAVVKYTDELKTVLENYLEVYLSLCNNENLLEDFTISIRRISNLADAAGLYVFCDVIQKKAGTTLKPLVIEMYIRALTTDMNELERQKDAKEKEKVEATTSRLAEAFCNLADFLDEHVKVARECVLTAFSLEPTKERMKNIETLARRSGYQVLDTGQEWKCKLHPPVLPSDELAWICPECGDWMCKPQLNIPLKINMALNEALQNSVLGISESLCDDLVVCLSNPRYQILSWFLPWDDLHRLCIMYLQDPQTTKNFVTELKFVDIDYSIFKGIKREPLDELAGIERGYEQYLDQDFVSDEETSSVSGDSMSQDSRPYSLGSDGAGDGPYLPLLLSQPKSDPNTLKSLRMFRPNLKRMRTNDPAENVPEKLLKGESGPLNLTQSQAVTSNFKDPSKMAPRANVNSYLNGTSSNTHHESHSKNVKVATLPPLGGQVANTVTKSIQVLLQPLKNSQLPKNQAGHKRHQRSKGTVTEATKKELMLKLLSKQSLSGSKESNSCKLQNNSGTQDFSQTSTEGKKSVKTPSRINKEPKSMQAINLTTKPQELADMETSTHNSVSTTNRRTRSPPNLQQTETSSCPPPNRSLPSNPSSDQPQNLQQENSTRHNENRTDTTKLAVPWSRRREDILSIFQTLEEALGLKKKGKTISMQSLRSQITAINSKSPNLWHKLPSWLEELLMPQRFQALQDGVTPFLENALSPTSCSETTQPNQDWLQNKQRLQNYLLMSCLQAAEANQDKTFPHLENTRATSCSETSQPHQDRLQVSETPEATNLDQDRSQNQPPLSLETPTEELNPDQLNNKSPSCSETPPPPRAEVKKNNPDQLPNRPPHHPPMSCLEITEPNQRGTQDQPPSNPKDHPPTEAMNLSQERLQKRQYPCSDNPLPPVCMERTRTSQDGMQNRPRLTMEDQLSVSCVEAIQLSQEKSCTEITELSPHQPPPIKENHPPESCLGVINLSQKGSQKQVPLCSENPLPSTCVEMTEPSQERVQNQARPLPTSCAEKNEPSQERVLNHPYPLPTSCVKIKEITQEQVQNQPNPLSISCAEIEEPSQVQQVQKQAHPPQEIPPSSQEQSDNQLPAPPEYSQSIPCLKVLPCVRDLGTPKENLRREVEVPVASVKAPSTSPICCTSPVPEFTDSKAPLETGPLKMQNSENCKMQFEACNQRREELTNPVSDKAVTETSRLKAPRQEIHLTIKISLDQIQTGLCPNRKKTLPCPSQKLAINSSENTASYSGRSTEQNQAPALQGKPVETRGISSGAAESLGKIADVCGDKDECMLNNLDVKCNNSDVSEGDVQTEETVRPEKSDLVLGTTKNCLGVIDDGIFSDLTDGKQEDLFFHNNNDYSSFVREGTVTENGFDELPKNFNLTENIRTYIKKPTKKLPIVNKDCVKSPTGDDNLDVCKNVNSSISIQKIHSNVQMPETNCKELKVILYRLPSVSTENGRHVTPTGIKKKCDRGRTPPRSMRRRKSMDKSENRVDKAPNRVQNHKLSPLQDINPRVISKENSKSCCDDLIKPKTVVEEFMIPRVLLERIHVDKKKYARSVLANVPGLNDYQMIRPTNVNHIVNVVQVSGGRPSQNVPIQSSQTSTQVTPHIQRIGQPRVVEQKPENSNSVPSTTTLTATTTTAKTTTSQPSTLINILSQQIIRPVTTQSNTVRRQAPLINILSQQIIRPSQTQKTASNTNVITTENNQVKPPITTEQTVISQANNVAKNTNSGGKISSPATTTQGSTILQFICKSTLPKFQQAFGKTVYQNSTDTSTTATTTVEPTNIVSDSKKDATKTVPVNVQPIQGSVIYSRQVPVGQTISLIPPGSTTRQVFRIATSNPEQISLVKDTVIHSKMSALLAAALQARPKNSEGQSNSEEKVTLTRPALVQNARIVKPVQLQIPPSVVRTTPQTNLSSTTLEQLREFDMVYKQVKERSSSTVPSETSNGPQENQEATPQRISVTYVNQLQKYTQLSPVVVVSTYNNLQPAASPALSVTSQGSSSPCVTPAPTLPKIATKTSKGKTLKSTTNNTAAKSSPIPKPQQKPQEDEHTTQRIFDILAEYAEQLRNSPDLNNKPAPRRRSNPPTNPSQNSKRKKSSSGSKKSNQSSNTVDIDADDITMGSEDSSGGGIVQLSVTDDEQSQAATINTPESTENSSPSSSRQLILAEGSACSNQSRNLIIADSSVGEALKMPNTAVIVPGSYIMPVSMVKGGQQIAVVSGGSKILATVPARSGQNMLLFQSFMNQNRKGSISAVKYSTIQPIAGISSQSLAGVSAQPPVILPSSSVAAAMALGQPLTLKKLNDDRDGGELLLAISPPKEDSKNSNDLPQPDSSTSVSSDSNDVKIEENTMQLDSSNEKMYQSYQKSVITNSVATSVIATTSTTCIKAVEENHSQNIINMNMASDSTKAEHKPNERMQSVLVTASSSNGPMLSHTTPRYRGHKSADANRPNNVDLPSKEGFLHNGDKTSNNETKTFRTNTAYYVNKAKKISAEKMDSEMQKQAALERELRLQKSLSEECEDLGVDEPSTSDLFPEADLLFDSNHSPSYDQSSQDIVKRMSQSIELKEEIKAAMNLFSDDDTSSSMRTDLFEYVEYQTVETALDYQARQLMNGNASSNESVSSGGEDSTLLAKCPTMAEVTLNSPISPETYVESTSNKFKFKYSNRKKGERAKQSEYRGEVVTSSEDTVGSTELGRISCEDDNFKLVHVAITKSEEKCELHCDEDLDSPSRRGGRRSVRKLCSCCNGSQDGHASRKRHHPSRPHTPAMPHKKAFLNKKR